MTRITRAVGLALLAIGVGCGKKPAPEPDAQPAPPDRRESVKRLRQIGKATWGYLHARRAYPAGVVGPTGGLGLSWRVGLLPFLGPEEKRLYERFKLDEPWDGDHNRKLLAEMPKVFAVAGQSAAGGKTHLRAFAGPHAYNSFPARAVPVMPAASRRAGDLASVHLHADIPDFAENTFMVVEAAEPVEWTKPDDLPFPDPGVAEGPAPLPKLGGVFPDGFHALMCNGYVRFFPHSLDATAVRALVTVDGKEELGPELRELLYRPNPEMTDIPTAVPAALPDAAARVVATENYRTLYDAMRAHLAAVGYLPHGLVAGKRFGLSWRVQLLPYIGEGALYKRFKLDEPWDSTTNKPLIEQMPSVFASPGQEAPRGHTFVRTTQGTGGFIWARPDDPNLENVAARAGRGSTFNDIFDGPRQTIFFVEARDAVPWTKPDELPVPADVWQKPNPAGLCPPLGGVFADGFHAVMGDGTVTFYKRDYPKDEVLRMLTPALGETVDQLDDPDRIAYSIPPKPAGPKK